MKYPVFLIALLLGACATTDDTSRTRAAALDQGAVAGVNEDGERVRCEYERETGSRMTTRVCRTESEWARIAENAQQVARDAQDRSLPDPFNPQNGQVGVNPRDR
tara:strand:+ start:3782 stop:4096 length:315 start_codon:yes stop_codon:yes gene_type:complete